MEEKAITLFNCSQPEVDCEYCSVYFVFNPLDCMSGCLLLQGHTCTRNININILLYVLHSYRPRICFHTEAKKMLLAVDRYGEVFLHAALSHDGWTMNAVKKICSILPRDLALELAVIQDQENKTAFDYFEDPKMREYIMHIYVGDSYPLRTPPTVLIFYSTTDRQTQYGKEVVDDAEAERVCVEKFFTNAEFPCRVKKDPTADELLNEIAQTQYAENLSGLIVFCMSHGERGLIGVKGNPGHILIKDIMIEMCRWSKGLPKVNENCFKLIIVIIYMTCNIICI